MSNLHGSSDHLPIKGETQDLHIYYYSTVEFVETPLSAIKGSIPLGKKEAMTRNHYRFAYNNRHQLVSVSFYNGETERDPNHTANLFTLSHRMEYHYEEGIERVSFYDKNSLPTHVLGNCSSFVFTLNDLGFRNTLYFLDKDDQRIVNSWGIYEYQWEYQDDGSVIENRYDDAGNQVSIRPGFAFYRLQLYFNPSGHIALMKNVDENGDLVENESGASQDRITTNANGNFLEWNVLNNKNQLQRGNGPNVAIGKQEFNEYGYEVGIEHRDENGHLIPSHYGIVKGMTSFDKFGNIQKRVFLDKNGLPSVHQNAGYHKLKITWDESGNRRKSLRYYDVDGHPYAHNTRGYHLAQYDYDSQYRLIKLSYHDVDGELINRKDNGRAYTLFTYEKTTGDRTAKHYNRANLKLTSK